MIHERLAAETQRVMEERGWSFRQAQRETGKSFTAIERMAKGVAVETDTIIGFATAVAGEGQRIPTVLYWLELAGKTEVIGLIQDAIRYGKRSVSEQAEEVYDPEAERLLALYASAGTQQRDVARRVLEIPARYVTAQ